MTENDLERGSVVCEIGIAPPQPVDYLEGTEKSKAVKLPGTRKCARIILKRGIAHDTELQHWVETARQCEVEKRSGAIELRSESGEAVMTWHLQGVWPSEITGPSFNASGSELAIESLELSVEGLSIG